MKPRRDVVLPAPAASTPVDQAGLDAALRLFVARFVVEDKRRQVQARLGTKARREETLATLPRWVTRAIPLEGADRSPDGLRARFGELGGIQLDAQGARRTTIVAAMSLGRGRASLFIGDAGRIALITAPDGPPHLVSL